MSPFLMGTTSSMTMHRLGKIVQRASAVVRKYGVCFFVCYRQDCRVAANYRYCFYSQAKNQVFRPAGAIRCTDTCQTLHGRRAPGSAWLCKISHHSVSRCRRVGTRSPKYQKFPLFGKESPRRGDSLDRFQIF